MVLWIRHLSGKPERNVELQTAKKEKICKSMSTKKWSQVDNLSEKQATTNMTITFLPAKDVSGDISL